MWYALYLFVLKTARKRRRIIQGVVAAVNGYPTPVYNPVYLEYRGPPSWYRVYSHSHSHSRSCSRQAPLNRVLAAAVVVLKVLPISPSSSARDFLFALHHRHHDPLRPPPTLPTPPLLIYAAASSAISVRAPGKTRVFLASNRTQHRSRRRRNRTRRLFSVARFCCCCCYSFWIFEV